MHLQLLELLQNSSFVKKLLREAKKTYVFSRTSKKARDRRYKWVAKSGSTALIIPKGRFYEESLFPIERKGILSRMSVIPKRK